MECNPLYWAVKYNKNVEILKVLVDNSGDLSDWIKLILLHCAARYNNADVINALVKYGADINGVDDTKWTSLHIAARYNKDPDVFKALIENNA